MTPDQIRRRIAERLRRDLIGPDALDEVIADRPSDRYLTGILFPRQQLIEADEDDEIGAGEDEPGEANEGASVPLASCIKPASAGLSFAVMGSGDSAPVIRITVDAARYEPCWEIGGKFVDARPDDAVAAAAMLRWRRVAPAQFTKDVVLDFQESGPTAIDPQRFPGLAIFMRASVSNGVRVVTVVLLNQKPAKKDREETEKNSWFQTRLTVDCLRGSSFVPRETSGGVRSKDDRTAALIYRETASYAVGHTASASWSGKGSDVTSLGTEWIPEAVVPAVSPAGDQVFSKVLKGHDHDPFSASWIAGASDEALVAGLALIPKAWGLWSDAREREIASLPPALQAYAGEHSKLWRRGIARMESGLRLLSKNAAARDALRAANRAMAIQRKWTKREPDLRWYPFQLAFQLLALESLLDPASDDRSVADLLWFPTGGGKTEAYLGCIALLLFYRRMAEGPQADGGGVGVIMRYTLRVLTTQQFERAAALVAAADMVRAGIPALAQQERFRIGLWIGGETRPKEVKAAHAAASAAMDLKKCPCCHKPLAVFRGDDTRFALECTRQKNKCDLAKHDPIMPVWTVDEDIYREPPSLLLGTVDKFAQIARNRKTGRLFGKGTTHRAPDLIIQDELHLISGPLGTVAGLYETAIDEFCRNGEALPKVIGSTATIRMADDQMRALFNRSLYQFPPPGLDAGNSCFAVRDDSRPGRLYLGVTSAGRSAKFTLQAVTASLLQAASAPGQPPELEDAYWTLVAYFNSLRELGGAHLLMLDDVPKSIGNYAARHGEAARRISEPEELTSRRAQKDIPVILDTLAQPKSSGRSPDSLLATNMISVGVDIPRLALMVINGQPKTVAEYIQASSRVGRDRVPGLVVSLFNAGKPRDRSSYESFCSWHGTLYRSVEATSVTPFAPRAIDRALKAVLAAMARHLVPGMLDDPRLDAVRRRQVETIRRTIVERCRLVDPEERLALDARLAAVLDEWQARVTVDVYWEDWKKTTLLMSAEHNAQLAAVGRGVSTPWPAPNSMRTIEPATEFRLTT